MKNLLLLGALATLAAHAHAIHTPETAYFRAGPHARPSNAVTLAIQ